MDEAASSPEPDFEFYINSILLTDGSTVPFAAPGVTAIVGGNNSGKSTFLIQVAQTTASPEVDVAWPYRFVRSVDTHRSGSARALRQWLDQHRPAHGDAGGKLWLGNAGPVAEHQVDRWPHANDLLPYLVLQATYQDHAGTPGRASGLDAPSHPLHILEDHPDRMTALNVAMDDIFGERLILDNTGGTRFLRLGTTNVPVPTLLGEKQDYVRALMALPKLSDQGDGMQRVVALLLTLLTSAYPVLLIDEPEAYLHPPQARAIGELIGRTAQERQTQIIIATHDRNVLSGLMASGTDRSVVRLNRQPAGTQVHTLAVNELRSVWADPALRYSNVLDGLFHRMVVLAEADQDCRFYQAALDALNETEPGQWVRPSDVLFVPTNGKANLAKVASALGAVAVPVVASPDLDVLNDEATLRRLAESLGGDWSAMEGDYRVATQQFRAPREPVPVVSVRNAIDRYLGSVLESNPRRQWDNVLKNEVRTITRSGGNPWSALKKYGEVAFQGESAAAAARLLDLLEANGVVPVRVGELERFGASLGVAKGAGWLPAALDAGVHRSPDALDHVRRLVRGGTSTRRIDAQLAGAKAVDSADP